MGSVIVVGSFNVDHVWHCAELPAVGATLAGRYASGPGGKGFNQAMAAARAGAATTFACALGDDAGGTLARDLAAAEGIALHAQASELPTGTAGIYVDARGRNTIVVGAGANGTLDPVHATSGAARPARGDVVLAQLESPPEAIAAALDGARHAGATTLLNPAPADAATTAGLLRLADLLTPNETEFAALLARHVGERVDADAVAALDGASLHALCRKLLPHGSVVVTLGSVGVFVSHPAHAPRGDAQPGYRLGAESVAAIDTTGAGDAFNGALAAALARAPGQPFCAQVRFANRYAGLSTERAGAALAMPLRAEVEARFGQ
ncbi:ribokinase [Pseudoxanthomonas broegbernensis]|uniref:Ribokinase n=1 Tax=Pseudoxanthomonas broegbernensis TaxID=83619 RepID=A0A7V8K6M6_9GAMM|nr:ribokinase [Pseudoxanthomonas broegbernensis]KAF1686094.1 ribokinase [Pseudoxanthomonas broegbernensis]MBB6063785.1 ribokinase [Pseudoxanthomonas broegbernensis]